MKLTPAWLTGRRRKALYRIGAAVCALLVGYGLFTAELALLWLGLGAALLGIAQDNVTDA